MVCEIEIDSKNPVIPSDKLQKFYWENISINDLSKVNIPDISQQILAMDRISYKIDESKDNSYILSQYPCSVLLLCREQDNTIMGGILYYVTGYGKKISRSFSKNGASYGRLILLKKKELFEQNGWYGEQSGAPAHMLKTHALYGNIKPIINKDVVSTVIGDVSFHEDFDQTGLYTRYIEAINKTEEKMLFGKPCMEGIKQNCDYTCTKSFDSMKVSGGKSKNHKYIVIKGQIKKRRIYINDYKEKYVILNANNVYLHELKGEYNIC